MNRYLHEKCLRKIASLFALSSAELQAVLGQLYVLLAGFEPLVTVF